MNNLTHSRYLPFILLTCSNVFMTFAWYGHLKFKDRAIWLVVLASWGIAFFEYVLQVPANRWGSNVYSAAQLKVAQEIITLMVFSVFTVYYLKNAIRWNHVGRICLPAGGRLFYFSARRGAQGRAGSGFQRRLRAALKQ